MHTPPTSKLLRPDPHPFPHQRWGAMAGWHPGRRWHASKPGADLTPARLPPVFLEVLEAMEEKRSALLEAMKRRSLELVRERCTCDLNLIHNGVGEECLLTPPPSKQLPRS